MNAPTSAAAVKPDFDLHLLVTFAPSSTRTQARRRARFTKEELAELAANIKAVGGILQPILARPHPKPTDLVKYEIVAGERRWLAAALSGLHEIPAVVRDVADADLITLQLTENLQRKTIDQLEEGEAYDELRKTRKINADQVADLLGVSRTTVFNRIKLLDLVPEARAPLDAGTLTPSVALLIARLPDPKMQIRAAKGCLGDHKALGDFDPEGTPYDSPLTHEDAEKYIKQEFTARLEGNAAISKAKTEGKVVIAGKDAEAIWKQSYRDSPAGYVALNDFYWSGQQRKSYASVLGDNPAGVVLVQNPHTGEAVKCLPRDKAIAIFKEKKAKLPNDLEPRQTPSNERVSQPAKPLTPAAKAKAEAAEAKARSAARRAEVKAQIEIDTRIAIFKALRAKAPAKLGKPELIELLTSLWDMGYGDELDPEICPRPKSFANCTEHELVRYLIDQLYGSNLDYGGAHYEKPRLATAKRYGVNIAKIEKDVKAKAEAQLKEEEDNARIKTKLAKASPLVKTKAKAKKK